MENTFCLDLNLPVSIDLSELDRLNSKILDPLQWQMHELTVDFNLNKFLEQHSISIVHAEAFYTPPNTVTTIHNDGNQAKVKINYVFGGRGSYMQWFSDKNLNTKKIIKTTPLGTPYYEWHADEVDVVFKAEIKQPSMVEVLSPHNVVNLTNEPRWCFSYVLADIVQTGKIDWSNLSVLDWSTACNKLSKFIVGPTPQQLIGAVP